MIDYSSIIEQLAPTALSTLVVSSIILLLNHRANRRLERYKDELQRQIAKERERFEEILLRRSAWHEKRATAIIELYGAFAAYLNFLRQHLYFGTEHGDITAINEFRRSCESLSIFLTEDLQSKVEKYSFELLEFWNWAIENQEKETEEIRRRLDYEIPQYLDRLRRDVRRYLREGSNVDEVEQ